MNGASGAVGSAAVQLAHLAGARVTAVTSSGNARLALSLGADHVIDYIKTDFAQDGAEYDVVMDCVGNVPFDRLEPLIKRGGVLLSVISDLIGVVSASTRSHRTGKRIIAGNVPFTNDQLAEVARFAEADLFHPNRPDLRPFRCPRSAPLRGHRPEEGQRRRAGLQHVKS